MKNNYCLKEYVSGISIHSCDKKLILNSINVNIQDRKQQEHICITNTESMYYAKRIPEHLNYINSSAFSLCDGMGSVIAGKFQGIDISRFNGPDLMLNACEYGQAYGWKHFFYGGKEGVADILVEKLKEKFPKMEVAGTYCPPFRELLPKEEKEIIKKIKGTEPDIIWVGLGLLKQEQWITKHKNDLQIPWSIGVGAAFDFYAGTVKRAPKIFRQTGFEWLYRLSKEPRMFKRNVNSFIFMFQAIGTGLNNKLKGKK